VHIESLRFEGHAIEQLRGEDGHGRPLDRFRLTDDAWEEH
jgi:predicted ArsR family transcriptional regulator